MQKKSTYLLLFMVFGCLTYPVSGLAKDLCKQMNYCAKHCAYARHALPVEMIINDVNVVPSQDMGQVLRLFSPACQAKAKVEAGPCSACQNIQMTQDSCNALSLYSMVMQGYAQEVDVVCTNNNKFLIKPTHSHYDMSLTIHFHLLSP